MTHPADNPLSRRHFGLLAAGGLAAAALPRSVAAASGSDSYEPTWPSIDRHLAAPEWFQDAKFGIYWHWGAFTTPEFGNEWYGRNMYQAGSNENKHHTATYGDPSVWGYDKFIDGGTDTAGNRVQFAPKLVSQGGKFDPDEWLRLVKDSGAKFAGPVAEHHDGFSMWDSRVNEWNSVARGPRLDLLDLFAKAVRAQGLKLLVSMHHAYNYNGFYDYAPRQTDPSLRKLYGQLPRAEEDALWLAKLKEVVDRAKPDILWQDFSLNSPGSCLNDGPCAVGEQQRLEFLAYYYNRAETWGKDVVATYKHFDTGFTNKGQVEDYERGGPADIVTPYWLTDDAISSSSWSYTKGIGYYSSTQMIHALIDRVSKGGNMLLNISPTLEGIIPDGQRAVLADIGTYLRRHGESIYATRSWSFYGEGPTKMGGGSFVAPLVGTAKDIRFTRDKASRVLYATVLAWPGTTLNITTLSSRRTVLSGLRSVELLGAPNPLPYSQDQNGLRVTLPATAPYSSPAYVVKLTFADKIPFVGPESGAGVFADPDYRGTNAGLTVGSYTATQLQSRSLAPRTISSLWPAEGYEVFGYPEDGFTGTPVRFATPSPDLRTNGFDDRIVSLRVRFDPARWFRIINVTNGLAMDGGGNVAAGSNLKIWTPDGSTNLQFRVEETGDGFVKLTNRTNGLVIDGAGATQQGAKPVQSTYTGATSQQWAITDKGHNFFVIANRATGLVLDGGGKVDSGSPLKVWTDDGSSNLRWQFFAV
ncbi:alpha-L-fucosidase [Lentzea nigeriaca]|uniref:alpha-L-fucosidase n=1 Tax=Lentzea nigeriaca TaxID=1128665 RepID=UPI001EF8BCB5|nr:alpha-L-fucosidase [Lentzea nigeriaca]MBM7860711.1 alpha-L-fucosidase [Lentzea nigeriaca]